MAIEVKSIVEDAALVARSRSQLVSATIELFCREGFHSTSSSSVKRGRAPRLAAVASR